MKAYELTARINADGELEVPRLDLKHLQENTPVRIIVLVNESGDSAEDETKFSSERFQASWQQAVKGETLPLAQLWEGIDVE
jgi:hypothetical protein